LSDWGIAILASATLFVALEVGKVLWSWAEARRKRA
jgi:hypothetical protein